MRIFNILKHHPLQQAAVLYLDISWKHACTIRINIYQTAVWFWCYVNMANLLKIAPPINIRNWKRINSLPVESNQVTWLIGCTQYTWKKFSLNVVLSSCLDLCDTQQLCADQFDIHDCAAKFIVSCCLIYRKFDSIINHRILQKHLNCKKQILTNDI